MFKNMYLAALCLLVGCNAAPTAGPASTDPFPEVTDRLRLSCNLASDAEIAGLIATTKDGRRLGDREEDVFNAYYNGCISVNSTPAGVIYCNTCFSAIVDAAYH